MKLPDLIFAEFLPANLMPLPVWMGPEAFRVSAKLAVFPERIEGHNSAPIIGWGVAEDGGTRVPPGVSRLTQGEEAHLTMGAAILHAERVLSRYPEAERISLTIPSLVKLCKQRVAPLLVLTQGKHFDWKKYDDVAWRMASANSCSVYCWLVDDRMKDCEGMLEQWGGPRLSLEFGFQDPPGGARRGLSAALFQKMPFVKGRVGQGPS